MFIKYMSGAFLNGQNISLNVVDSGSDLCVEQNGKVIGRKSFTDSMSADSWYSAISGRGLGKLDNAMNAILGVVFEADFECDATDYDSENV